MKKLQIIIILCFSALLGCLKEPTSAEETVKFTVFAERPKNLPELNFNVLRVRLINQRQIAYEQPMDSTGTVEFNLPPDRYEIKIEGNFALAEDDTVRVTGSSMYFLLTKNGIVGETDVFQKTIALNAAIAEGGLIIRELYYAGCQLLAGGTYQYDQYIEIYNNSSDTLYLDSLCVTTVAPANSTANNPWHQTSMDTLGLFSYLFMIPGNGSTHPLEPGKGVVVTINAVHHSQTVPSLQLNRAHFVIYDPTKFTHSSVSVPDPSVVLMTKIGDAQGTAYSMSIGSPAVVIFRIPNYTEYFANTSVWKTYAPGAVSGLEYWNCLKEWIIDGVECITNPTATTVNKRLPASVDNSYAYLKNGQYQGNCITRKVKRTVNGRVVYQDTNDSEKDFDTDVPPNPSLRP